MIAAECVAVSPEMIALIGACDARAACWPDLPVALRFTLGAKPALQIRAHANDTAGREGGITLIVARAACARLFGRDADDGEYHLPHELRLIAHALAECPHAADARTTYRLGKAIELLCETFRLIGDGALVPSRAEGALSLADGRRVMAARRMIDDRWREKLTLDSIARACGLNRMKLTRGFRELFDCTVADAIAERRLEEARRMLRTTDQPVSTIGYASGYLNNASFARAFGRRFGLSPSDYRAARLAA